MFESTRITYIYWPMEHTPKASFFKMLELTRISYINWPIEGTPKTFVCWDVQRCNNYLHVLANGMHFKTLICEHVLVSKNYLHLLASSFFKMLELTRITYIYWPIECTPKPSFVGMFKGARITYIY
jgi:hypothetical protein